MWCQLPLSSLALGFCFQCCFENLNIPNQTLQNSSFEILQLGFDPSTTLYNVIYSILMGSNSYFLSCVGYFRTVYSKKNVISKMKRGQDIRLPICSYVAEKPCGCLYKLTCCNAKFHSLFKCKLYL